MTSSAKIVTALALLAAAGSATRAADFPLPLSYNFNGMVHPGEAGVPDDLNGYRSISDRGLSIDGGGTSLGTNPIVGATGIAYTIVQNGFALDIVHLGNRNQVDNGNWTFDAVADGDNVGVQPAWLLNVDQKTPQSTDISGMNLVLDSTSEIGLLFQTSNGGASFQVVLGFTDASSVIVTVAGPDWFGTQNPPAAGAGVASQTRLGTFTGTGQTDFGFTDASLNVVESVISVPRLIADGLGNQAGKRLASITFQNQSNQARSSAILAATVRTGLGPPSNDLCSNAITVVAGDTPGENIRATGTDITGCGTGDSADVWYRYQATSTGEVEVRTCGAGFDTTLAIFNSCAGQAIACDDNGCGLASRLRFQAQANQTYLIRVAGANQATGRYTLTIEPNPPVHTDLPVPLAYNFNGMVHSTEAGDPDNLDGYRSISDRGLILDGSANSLGAGTLVGDAFMTYQLQRDPRRLDIVHIGNRNTVNGGGQFFDAVPNGDAYGVQPAWLADPDQTGPQRTDVSSLNATLTADTRIGVLFQVSNGGGFFYTTLEFDDSTAVTVLLSGPDWFGDQNPSQPGQGVEVQRQLGVFYSSANTDIADPDVDLNVVESVISVQRLLIDGFGDFTGKRLRAITFSDRSNTNAGYAVIAATVRDAAVGCPADFNGDNQVDFFDYLDFAQAFSAEDPSADFNGDNQVDFFDYLDFAIAFDQGCD
jgi:hypothetical protein